LADSLSPCQSLAMAIKNLIQTRQLLFISVLFPPRPSTFTPTRHLYPLINRQLSLITIKCHHQNWYPNPHHITLPPHPYPYSIRSIPLTVGYLHSGPYDILTARITLFLAPEVTRQTFLFARDKSFFLNKKTNSSPRQRQRAFAALSIFYYPVCFVLWKNLKIYI
jgi:hypothetical protein